MEPFSLDIVNQAVTNLFIGIGLALVNVIVRYFAPSVPRVITVLTWPRLRRAMIGAYLIALVIQLITSPFFRSLIHPASYELAWSPYQAIWNVLGVIVVDLIAMVWSGMRRGAEVGRKQLDAVKTRAAEGLEDLSAQLPNIVESREGYEERRKAEEETATQTAAERKERLDDRLKDY
jgi:hypothetical protein